MPGRCGGSSPGWQVFGPSASQSMVFDCVKPLVKSALDGRDVCLLAYGQTGSGKTHTLVGPDGGRIDAAASTAGGEAGMIPRTVHELFALLASQGPGKGAPLNGGVSGPGSVQQVFLTVLEIYNETVRTFGLVRLRGCSAALSPLFIAFQVFPFLSLIRRIQLA